jgi:hypothetical protein
VFGLLNGLSMTLRARTSMLVAFAELAEQMDRAEAAGAHANGASASGSRRLLEA